MLGNMSALYVRYDIAELHSDTKGVSERVLPASGQYMTQWYDSLALFNIQARELDCCYLSMHMPACLFVYV